MNNGRAQFTVVSVMRRRTLLKLLGLLPFMESGIMNSLVKAPFKQAAARRPLIPEFFPKWDKTVDGLEEASKWVMEVERLRLPSDVVFPNVGQVWRAIADCEVTFRAYLASKPLSFSDGLTLFPQGEQIRILGVEHLQKPLHVCFEPLRYGELEVRIVPDEIRCRSGYKGYKLTVRTANTIGGFSTDARCAYFNEAFKRITGVSTA